MLVGTNARRIVDHAPHTWAVLLDGLDVSKYALAADDEEGWVEVYLSRQEDDQLKVIQHRDFPFKAHAIARGIRRGYVELEEIW